MNHPYSLFCHLNESAGLARVEPFGYTTPGSFAMDHPYSLFYHLNESGGRGRSRTCDRLVRSQVLYPAELRALDIFIFQLYKSLSSLFYHLKKSAGLTEVEPFDYTAPGLFALNHPLFFILTLE